ncbi:unnamed protein product [Schistosoma mattheei]|uniref:Uncharacterized protein n=1 Tax=Schistosoma mattheei TaxID=31246 RepID=A0A3P8E0K8_9TREM|nr:unnamed protein product [Schistosoma mattheei]
MGHFGEVNIPCFIKCFPFPSSLLLLEVISFSTRFSAELSAELRSKISPVPGVQVYPLIIGISKVIKTEKKIYAIEKYEMSDLKKLIY